MRSIELVHDKAASQNGMDRFRVVDKLTGEMGGLVSKGVNLKSGAWVPFGSKIDNRGYSQATQLTFTGDIKIGEGVFITLHSGATPMSKVVISDTEFMNNAKVAITPKASVTRSMDPIRVLKNCVFGADSISEIRGDFFTIEGLYVGESSNVDLVTKISKFNEAHNSGNPIRGSYLRVKDVKFRDNSKVSLYITEGRLILDNVKLGSGSALISESLTSLIMKDVSACSDCQIEIYATEEEADGKIIEFMDVVLEDCEISAEELKIEVNKSAELYGPRENYEQGGYFSVPEN